MSLALSLLVSLSPLVSEARLACDVCKEFIHKVDKWMATNSTITDVEDIAKMLCQADLAGGECRGPVTSWQCQQVCELAVQTYVSMTDYLLIRYIDPEFICFHIRNNSLKCPLPSPGPDPTPIPNIIVDNETRPIFNDSDLYGYMLQIPGTLLLRFDSRTFPNLSIYSFPHQICIGILNMSQALWPIVVSRFVADRTITTTITPIPLSMAGNMALPMNRFSVILHYLSLRRCSNTSPIPLSPTMEMVSTDIISI